MPRTLQLMKPGSRRCCVQPWPGSTCAHCSERACSMNLLCTPDAAEQTAVVPPSAGTMCCRVGPCPCSTHRLAGRVRQAAVHDGRRGQAVGAQRGGEDPQGPGQHAAGEGVLDAARPCRRQLSACRVSWHARAGGSDSTGAACWRRAGQPVCCRCGLPPDKRLLQLLLRAHAISECVWQCRRHPQGGV